MKKVKFWTVVYHMLLVALVGGLILTACGDSGLGLAQSEEAMSEIPIEEQAMAIPVPPGGLSVTLTIEDIPGAHRFYKEVTVEARKGSFDIYKIAIAARRLTAPELTEYKELEISKTNSFIIRMEGQTDVDVIYNAVAIILDVNNDIEFSATIQTIILQGPDVDHI